MRTFSENLVMSLVPFIHFIYFEMKVTEKLRIILGMPYRSNSTISLYGKLEYACQLLVDYPNCLKKC